MSAFFLSDRILQAKKKSFSKCKKKLVHLAFTGPGKVNPHWVAGFMQGFGCARG